MPRLRPVQPTFFPLVALVALALCGCGTMKNGRPWGEVKLPRLSGLGVAAGKAVTDPYTWVPAAGAAVFKATGWDRTVSSWASRKTPVFGSGSSARRASNALGGFEDVSLFGTILATPSGDELPGWALHKAEGLAVDLAAYATALSITGSIKSGGWRERPDRTDRGSFPSGHTTRAFVDASLSRRNLEAMRIDPYLRGALDGSLTAMAAATGWARIEGEKHYPSDVLAGAALGNFVAGFFNDAFLGGPESPVAVGVQPSEGRTVLTVRVRF